MAKQADYCHFERNPGRRCNQFLLLMLYPVLDTIDAVGNQQEGDYELKAL